MKNNNDSKIIAPIKAYFQTLPPCFTFIPLTSPALELELVWTPATWPPWPVGVRDKVGGKLTVVGVSTGVEVGTR